MIQRVQSIYLLIIVILSCQMLFFPLFEFTSRDGQIFSFTFTGIRTTDSDPARIIQPLLQVTILIPVTGFISLVCIFLYKKRRIQMWLSLINFILIVVFVILVFLFTSRFTGNIFSDIHPCLVGVFPLIEIILSYMAYLRIKADENLVRSYDRLR